MTAALCDLDDIADPGAKGPFTIGDTTIFLVRKDSQVFGYVNSCTHIGAPLEMEEDGFLDSDRSTILCSVHGARFDLETGACLLGACKGKGLQAYPVLVRNGKVIPGTPSDGI